LGEASGKINKRLARFAARAANGKTLIVVNSYNQIGTAAQAIDSLLLRAAGDVRVLCFKSELPDEFLSFKERVTLSEGCLDEADCRAIDNYIFNDISLSWDKEAALAFPRQFIYRGVPLARVAEFNFQFSLIFKLKAAVVVSRAIEKEKASAVFFIDTNGELGGFDRFVRSVYGIPAAAVTFSPPPARGRAVRGFCAGLAQRLTDLCAALIIRHKKWGKRVIDVRLSLQLGGVGRDFMPAIFENGLRIRLKCLRENGGYAPFCVDSGRLAAFLRRRPFARSVKPGFFKQRFIFQGLDYWEIVRHQLDTMIKRDFFSYRRNIDLLFWLKRQKGVNLVILRNDVKEAEKAVVLAARQCGVYTFVVQHGIMVEPNGNSLVHADRLGVWGNYSLQWYKGFGSDESKISVIGCPNADNIALYLKQGRPEGAIASLNLARRRHTVALFTTGIGMLKTSAFTSDDLNYNLVRHVLKAVRGMEDVNLIVKLHPNEEVVDFSRLLSAEDRRYHAIAKDIDLYGLISASDLALTIDSTVGLEAVIMGKPLLVVNLDRRPDLAPYVRYKVAFGVYRRELIGPAIERYLRDEGLRDSLRAHREHFLDEVVYRAQGAVRDRVLSLIPSHENTAD
jgi:hypothetical protein